MKKRNTFISFLPIFSYIIGPILSFAILPIITNALDPSEYGIYNYYISIINYIVLITLMPGINSYILRYLNRNFPEYKKDKEAIFKFILYSTLFYIVCLLFFMYIYKDFLFLYIATVYYFVNMTSYYKSFLNVNGNKFVFSVLTMLNVLSQYIFVFIAYIYLDLNTMHLLLGSLVFSILVVVIIVVKLINNNNSNFNFMIRKTDSPDYRKVIKFIVPSIGIALAGLILSSGDRIIIKNLLDRGDYYVGIYAINYTLYAQIVDVIIAVFYLYIPSYLYVKYEEYGINEYLEKLKIIIETYLLVTTFIITVAIFNYDKINYLLFNSSYNVSTKISVYIVVGQFYFGLYRMVSNYYLVKNRIKIVMYLLGLIGFMNILMNLYFVPIYGYVSAAMTTLFCYVFLFIVIYYLVTKETKKHLISMSYWLMLCLPILFLSLSPKTGEYTDKFHVFLDLIKNTLIIFGIYSFVFWKKIKKNFSEYKN
ncbi:polysaccharide biosynthesis protein [Enterococcus alcedinis]|uniref:Polysaccharide biosynthesis protein n=1 Tax=Enterococcus alcedinis TaxID=1274384 RepID=A0A917N4I5_9ENTE|nr:oligosaccharide flippase family protein [Enterococcus alcedinis]MBP2102096.1 O-antigen/teichoic acid export membrane protein [Enterococcus alcedinis]GGI65658.1 polysaccharide biosynthesis protein [Enterococcus alcedinis]